MLTRSGRGPCGRAAPSRFQPWDANPRSPHWYSGSACTSNATSSRERCLPHHKKAGGGCGRQDGPGGGRAATQVKELEGGCESSKEWEPTLAVSAGAAGSLHWFARRSSPTSAPRSAGTAMVPDRGPVPPAGASVRRARRVENVPLRTRSRTVREADGCAWL